MTKNFTLILFCIIIGLWLASFLYQPKPINLHLEKLKQKYAVKPISGIDHSQLKELQREFKSPQEVTEACIACHNQRHKEIMNSSHWNWERLSYIEGRGIARSGKRNVINNYCIGSNTNEQVCAVCHIGFGMNNDHFDFDNARNVDCMVCHDNSEEYLKGSAMAGYPDRNVNLGKVAQSVGNPKKMNCGSCHFYGGGGNNVKHGDLEDALLDCSRETDVHMAANGMDMECVACHTAENHQMKGKLYSVSSDNYNRSTCESCHGNTPHFENLINGHTAKVSCQACHIPHYSKINATKTAWKWSTSGKLENGQAIHTEDSLGNHTYMSQKGSFTWERNIQPEYMWFNGTADHYLLGDSIKEVPVILNRLFGSHDEKQSKIIPVKIHRGDQIYDKKLMRLIQPKLWSAQKGDSAYWMDFDWNKASAAGMKSLGLEYSGEYGFIETEMYWPINHMVSKKEESVGCAECHTRENGRLQNLAGFYLPGRDRNKNLDFAGSFLLFFSIAGVVIHAAARMFHAYKKNKIESEIID